MSIKLNMEQQEVVNNWNDNILLTAIPGSGKTRTIVQKIIESLQNRDDNRLIVAITYTNRAADEMLERINESVEQTERLFIGTIHSFCYEYIFKPNIDKTNYFTKKHKIISPDYQVELLKKISKNKILSKEEKQLINFGRLNTKINSDGNFYPMSKILMEILDEYYHMIKNNNLLNFDLLLFQSYKILNDFPHIASNLKDAINSFYIDEYQDTHQIQYDILHQIYKSNDKANQQLIFVGDENQAIYTSLGSILKNKDDLEYLFNTNFVHYKLSGCYRSTQSIIDYYKNFSVVDLEMFSKLNVNDNSIIKHYFLPTEQAYEKVSKLIPSLLKKGIEENEICIMAPWWYLLVPISRKLRDLMPTIKFDAPEITPIKRNEELPLYGLSKIICMVISHENISYKRKLSYEFKKKFKDFYNIELQYDDDELLTIIEKRRNNIGTLNGLDYIKQEMNFILFEFLKMESSIVKTDLEIFLDEIERRLNDERFKLTNTIDTFTSMFSRKNGIVISTCHGVKGEEYDVVICLNVNEGKIPHFLTLENRDEAKRLLFVMFSRARQEIYVFAAKDHHLDSPTKEITHFFNNHE